MPAEANHHSSSGRQRVDKWLWFARIVKTRTLAQKLAVSGRVRVNREKCDSASTIVKVDDVLTITLDRSVKVLQVLGAGARRGPPPEAQLLYADLSPKAPPRPPAPAIRERGAGRPTKRDQRRMAALKGRAGDDFPPDGD